LSYFSGQAKVTSTFVAVGAKTGRSELGMGHDFSAVFSGYLATRGAAY
jgi:hypothetical protein